MSIIFLALGSNVGNSKQNIEDAISLLKEKVRKVQVAKFYTTKAVGYTKQDNFVNTALKGETSLEPIELFHFVKEIEKKMGRVKRFRWGPREIDIDIIFYKELIYRSKKLEIPHPRMHERDFVLKPFLDIEKDFVHPVLKKKLKDLYLQLSDNQKSII
ncbi:2-amino-4-hydroxy-6-hydroxymethyldihydropteridine diphosphokinase [Candidatus Roizmanbacteria bacterium RIFCSPLOWO2_12_FULL_40_12]|uniref:2-amino-4-hydroxy-6-hydroxymethyldihydropteridine diphosphokinase n=1 Tax=Candidatus Roizmanbacteria bacterium RIFCSPLOWO2_01_FULL_40_42 TaxID=1802066 RepID=A0A1F7J2R2_9BACT|nr:MAG: 2-amino-4-hydroxy-6-hydroxymethyldihydropteridine diphosphokinase [Candidatus Roizmanbacteria bacterium RIFCSPHIGHO2_01_FULL_40_98]OGK27528.1 MAG: 2-amino-4-hydroxy-6-hydroxymethyldihydropteridine diphosphokinase [Candidatus Roizmanbacteria bacterium RIFCSPHIGHO2_02_FULL_40_53]OGK30284.1 MAG: 2-amino-4-hydroxy-6-hydroxymethyldihydropteridine diphosphokinase [Candidatus Roizmanbacteria bacterium RIFCSPHIGHO2_12_41_18]OGK37116.1 MAG: 2-amino-4-hydroxy-6-hydroxymethyldihydropteridine diphos